MNANELADELHDLDVQASQQSLNDWAEQASDMLRQQQAEIERLTRENRDLGYYIEGWHVWKQKLQEFIK